MPIISSVPMGGGAVTSVFGRTGVVVAANGDYTATQVGALASTSTLNAIATANAASAAIAVNAQKITGLANGSAASDAAAFGQIPNAVLFDSGALGAPAANFDATGLSAAWVDLVIVLLLRGTNATTSVVANLILNNDSAANYDQQELKGQGNVASSQLVNATTSATSTSVAGGTAPANAADTVEVVIPSYSATTFQKVLLIRGSLKATVAAFGLASSADVAFWRNTAAVNRVTVTPSAGNWDVGSRMRILARL